jgi:hypothetical protein
VSEDIAMIKIVLAAAVAGRKMNREQASAKFRDFVRTQLYVSQYQLGGTGYCMCASKIIALKFAGTLGMSVDYKQVVVAEGGTIRDRKDPARIMFTEKWVQNQGRDSRLNTDDIARIAQDSAIGTGSTRRLTLDTLDWRMADDLMRAGGITIVGTFPSPHWMVALHDPFLNKFLLVDTMAKGDEKPIMPYDSPHPMLSRWGRVVNYVGVFTE